MFADKIEKRCLTKMDIKYLGHSAFLIKGEKFSVCFDPFSDIGYDMEQAECDYLISSHGHFDHAAYSRVKYKTLITEKTKNAIVEVASGDVFRRVQTFHDENRGALRGINFVTVFNLDGVTFCHLGDIGEKFSEEIAQKIGKIDVLFVPVGGTYTIDAFEAKRYVSGLNPKIVIPMHYKTKKCALDIKGKSEFLSLFAKENIKNVGSVFELNANDLTEEQIVLNTDDRLL